LGGIAEKLLGGISDAQQGLLMEQVTRQLGEHLATDPAFIANVARSIVRTDVFQNLIKAGIENGRTNANA
jgi:hypothetical protein